jgi:Transcriptional Coactivator p15 (PC4)
MDDNIHYNKLIDENMEKGFQVRLVVNSFRDTEYIQLRKYFLTYEGDWQASREGISVPATIENIYGMLDGLLDICAKAEGEDIIRHYAEKILKDKNESVS